jgi:mycothiol system anti-sigma-R factor
MPDRSGCEAIVRQMWAYLDAAVSDVQQQAVAAHLDECAECAAHFDFAAEFLRALAATPAIAHGEPALRERVLAALAAEGFVARDG